MSSYEKIPSRKVWLQAIAPSMLFCALAFQLCIRVEIINSGYEVQYLQKAALEQDSRLRSLRYQHATLNRPSRISKSASGKLALNSLRPQQLRKVVFRENSVPQFAQIVGAKTKGDT